MAAELGVDRDGDPHRVVEGGAEGLLELRPQPALDLVAGELVGDRDDRGALVQGDRAAAGEPGTLVGRQLCEELLPREVEPVAAPSARAPGATGAALVLSQLVRLSTRGLTHAVSPSPVSQIRLGPTPRVPVTRSGRTRPRRVVRSSSRSTRLSTGCACRRGSPVTARALRGRIRAP